MKKSILIFASALLAHASVLNAQNIFPASGNTGIGTLSPAASLQVIGSSRFGSTANYTQVSATGQLSFSGTAGYTVAGNKYAFTYSGNPNYGLFFNSTLSQYEFRDGSAIPRFYVNANNGNGVFTGNLKVGAYTLPSTDGLNGQVLTTNGAGTISWSPVSSSYWSLTGNAGTSSATNFIGTKDAVDFVARTNNVERFRIKSSGASNFAGFLGVNGAAADTAALKINTAGVYTGIVVSDPGNKNVLYSVKSGDNNGIYIMNSNSSATASVIKAVSKSNAYAVEGVSDYAGVGVYGSAYYGDGVLGRDNGGGNGVAGVGATGVGVSGYTSDGFAGVSGVNSGYGEGILGNSTYGSGVYGAGAAQGVYGSSSSGTGVYGSSSGSSSTSGYGGQFVSSNYRGIYVSSGIGWFAGYFVGDVYATGVFQSSDAKLKKNIKEVSNAMDIINRLQPKNYEFRNDGIFAKMNLPVGSHYGLLAQDVEKILPGLVKQEKFQTRDNDLPQTYTEPAKDGKLQKKAETQNESLDFKAVNYTELIPVMIKGMQEQDKTIKEQSQKIEALMQLVEKLSGNQQQTATDASAIASSKISSAKLEQNVPNPLSATTTIRYFIPAGVAKAQLVINSNNGAIVKQITLNNSGNGVLNIDASTLSSGAYTYTLVLDGKAIETKKMLVVK